MRERAIVAETRWAPLRSPPQTIQPEQRLDDGGRRGTSTEIALELLAAASGQELRLFWGFDSLRHHREAEAMGQRQGGRHDGLVSGSNSNAADEGAIDLEHPEGEALERGQ
jgi:hypothetical protein